MIVKPSVRIGPEGMRMPVDNDLEVYREITVFAAFTFLPRDVATVIVRGRLASRASNSLNMVIPFGMGLWTREIVWR
jgi:hypothetical protein